MSCSCVTTKMVANSRQGLLPTDLNELARVALTAVQFKLGGRMRSLFVLCVMPMMVRVASFVVVPPVRTVQCRGDAFVDAAAPAALSGGVWIAEFVYEYMA